MNALGLLHFIIAAVPFMIQLYTDDYIQRDQRETLSELAGDLSLPRIKRYDYIIVGAGSAGCLLAERLSRTFSVLLLEAGGYPVPATYNLFMSPEVEGSTIINNQFTTVPQQHFPWASNKVFTILTGKMLGGSGSHNGAMYNRCSPYDYDFFAKFTGDPSFKYDNIIKYFKRFEHFRGWLVNKTEWMEFGHSGNFVIEKSNNPFIPAWLAAGEELRFQIADPNPTQRVSFTAVDKSQYDSLRSSSYTAFIQPIDGRRPTLRVLKYSTVEQILIKDATAYGVTYKRHGIPQIAHASREVIISAGAIGSPMLLLKSGIGPLDTLQSAGIPVHSVIPAVGQNLRNHVQLLLTFKVNNAQEYAKYFPTTEEELEKGLNEFQQAQPNRNGYFTVGEAGQGFVASSRAKMDGEGNYPDIQLILFTNRIDEARTTVSVNVALVRGKSVGHVALNATAYLQGEREDTKLAVIDPQYFSIESDVTVMLEGIRVAVQAMTKTAAFAPLNLTLEMDTQGPCRRLQQGSDDYWKCVIGLHATTSAHWTSTNRMGADGDGTSVLYANFTVKGIGRLRVVDASVLPRVTNANTNAPTLVFAEKAAELILTNPINGAGF